LEGKVLLWLCAFLSFMLAKLRVTAILLMAFEAAALRNVTQIIAILNGKSSKVNPD